MQKCRACQGTGSVIRDGGRVACQVCKGTGMFTDGDKAARASAMSSDAIGCVVGLVVGILLAFGGFKLGYQLGGSIGESAMGVKFTANSQIATYGSYIGAAAGFLAGFGVSRLFAGR